MKSYRDYLNDRNVPKGPWVVDGPRFQSEQPDRQEPKLRIVRRAA